MNKKRKSDNLKSPSQDFTPKIIKDEDFAKKEKSICTDEIFNLNESHKVISEEEKFDFNSNNQDISSNKEQ